MGLFNKETPEKAAERKINEIRNGIPCSILIMVEGEKQKHSDFMRGIGTLGLGLTGYAMMSGKEKGFHEVEKKAIICVVPMGIVISPENENDLRIPHKNVISSIEDPPFRGPKLHITLTNGQYLNLNVSSEYIIELKTSINYYALGIEEEGWY